jgi:allantoin racemase
VLVLNPNSSSRVTAGLAHAADGWARPGVRFDVAQIDAAPEAITSPADHARVAPLVVDALTARDGHFDAAIVACHGDPGVDAARLQVTSPVVGIGATSLHAAAAAVARFAVLALSTRLVDSKWRQVDQAGLRRQCVGIWPVDTSVEHGLDPDPDLVPYLTAGRQACAAGAELLVLGCAGMGPVATRLAADLAVPVLDATATTANLAAELASQHAAAPDVARGSRPRTRTVTADPQPAVEVRTP